MAQYVQHISGQGKWWELADDGRICNQSMAHSTWVVWETVPGASTFYLPKSEYRLVEPPEKWVDVTEKCVVKTSNDGKENIICCDGEWTGYVPYGYRLTKIGIYPFQQIGQPLKANRTAFIVEKRES